MKTTASMKPLERRREAIAAIAASGVTLPRGEREPLAPYENKLIAKGRARKRRGKPVAVRPTRAAAAKA